MTTLPPQHRRRWQASDHDLLAMLDAGLSVPTIARRLGRTRNATINHLVNYHKISPQDYLARIDGMGMRQAAEELGVRVDQIHDWIKRGWLKATKRRINRQIVYSIEPAAMMEFIAMHGGYAKLRPNADWRELVEDARATFRARYISRNALGKLLYVARPTFIRWEVAGGFPQPALMLHSAFGGAHYERAAVRAWLKTHPQWYTRTAREKL